jgi:FixJ family two-component response regulator
MEVRNRALNDIALSALIMRFPDYLPPVSLEEGVDDLLCTAARCFQKCCASSDMLLVSGYYEDHREASECCVVLSLQLQRPGTQDVFSVENTWLEEFGEVAEELLTASVELRIETAPGSMNMEFRLPVHAERASQVRHRNAVLLVEDDALVRHAAREVLEMAGYEVIVATDAEEGVQCFHLHRRSLCIVISDVTMPGRDGRELARAIHACMPQMPVILMSGYSNPVTEDPSKRLYTLAKPFNSDRLLRAVRRGLEAYHQLPLESLQDSRVSRTLVSSTE